MTYYFVGKCKVLHKQEMRHERSQCKDRKWVYLDADFILMSALWWFICQNRHFTRCKHSEHILMKRFTYIHPLSASYVNHKLMKPVGVFILYQTQKHFLHFSTLYFSDANSEKHAWVETIAWFPSKDGIKKCTEFPRNVQQHWIFLVALSAASMKRRKQNR